MSRTVNLQISVFENASDAEYYVPFHEVQALIGVASVVQVERDTLRECNERQAKTIDSYGRQLAEARDELGSLKQALSPLVQRFGRN